MSTKTVLSPPSNSDELPPHIEQIIITHRLARTIESAHENGALLFLAAHLTPLLEKMPQQNRPSTPTELEALIVRAAKKMLSE